MERLGIRDRILIGVTLFSMFFGAGNLIFPPFLGAQAGTAALPSFAGFAASAVGVPVLGVIAVTLSGGLPKLASRVHPVFSAVYVAVLYLAIGPCLAIPRTASTSFSMAVTPFLRGDAPSALAQFAYSAVFFAAAAVIALHPERLTEYLGKKLTPILLTLIVVLFAASAAHPAGGAAAPAEAYGELPLVQGFLYGYQTMDTLAALNFGMIVAMNIQARGIREEKRVMAETVSAGWIAGLLLLAVYAMLTYVGLVSGTAFPSAANGTEVLTHTAGYLFGNVGTVILAAIFVIACFNTCVGLLSCCGNYFSGMWPRPGYRGWVFLFALVSMVISNVGLDAILKVSEPVLNAIYPLAILLIALSCAHRLLARFPLVYPWAAGFCAAASILTVLDRQGLSVPALTAFLEKIPGHRAGFGWVLPTAAGILIGLAVGTGKRKIISHHR
ncbi:MAG: branched-chain amino acid transport system II carrier protein [Eubacteriales bacterium]|nr:branched-chain amino acid transport system II carrier protein [Eubacteriales bacterium]